ncbi:MAG: ABC transporter ATP-binding protein [Acidimicrobiales bacterium]
MGLEVTDVSVRFGGLAALTDVCLEAPNGSITGLIGPNGAGKTTLFNVIMGMQRPTGGTIRLDGRDLRGLSPHRRARLGLGSTFQRLELFGTLTVGENLAVAASMGRRRFSPTTTRPKPAPAVADELLGQLGLSLVADIRADALPTGTGRLVELGRAMAVRPTVLLLDEPASGQDAEETARFAAVLRGLADDGLAVLLVEHDMDLVMGVCEQVVVLDYGRVICTGEPAAVQGDPAVQQAYLGSMSGATDG